MKHKNYLKTLRLKSGLTQKDVCDLIGLKSNARLSQIESREKRPGIDVILVCCLIYPSGVAEMIPSELNHIESKVIARATELYQKLKRDSKAPNQKQRLRALKRIADLDTNQSNLRRNVQQQKGK